MKRLLLALLALCAAVPLLAEVSALPPPVVVVYPLTATGPVAPDAGSRLALLFAQQLSAGGGIIVKPAMPGIVRTDYLTGAQSAGADYYVTGYLTPLGDEISLLLQVVSTYSGSVVWSSTVQVQTFSDAAGQADLLRQAILTHAGRSLAALEAPPPVPSASPPPPTNGHNDANLSQIFQHHAKATPRPAPAKATASPSPRPAATAAPSAAPSGAIVTSVGGSASDADRTFAAAALGTSLARAGLGGTLVASSSAGDIPSHAAALCAQYHSTAIYGGTLEVRRTGGGIVSGTHADFTLLRYDCASKAMTTQRVATDSASSAGGHDAIDRAVRSAFAAGTPAGGKR